MVVKTKDMKERKGGSSLASNSVCYILRHKKEKAESCLISFRKCRLRIIKLLGFFLLPK